MTMNEDPGFILREYVETDNAFVFDSWMSSYANKQDNAYINNYIFNNRLSREEFKRIYQRVLDRLVPRCHILVACDPVDTSQIFGWICYEQREKNIIVHYLYVKEAFRKEFGIGKTLLFLVIKQGTELSCSHLTGTARKLLKAKQIVIKYVPHEAF